MRLQTWLRYITGSGVSMAVVCCVAACSRTELPLESAPGQIAKVSTDTAAHSQGGAQEVPSGVEKEQSVPVQESTKEEEAEEAPEELGTPAEDSDVASAKPAVVAPEADSGANSPAANQDAGLSCVDRIELMVQRILTANIECSSDDDCVAVGSPCAHGCAYPGSVVGLAHVKTALAEYRASAQTPCPCPRSGIRCRTFVPECIAGACAFRDQ